MKTIQFFDFLVVPRYEGKLSHSETFTESIRAQNLEDAKIIILRDYETTEDLIMYKGKTI